MPSIGATALVIDAPDALRNETGVLDSSELLARLEAKGIRNVDIARALDLPDSRIPEIRRKERALKLDEAVKLVRAFELESDRLPPLSDQVIRLVVRYVAAELGSSPDEAQLQELTRDVQAFSEFVADPKVRRSVEAAEGFFRAMTLRRPTALRVVQPESDPGPTR
jgi:hypothetical protein